MSTELVEILRHGVPLTEVDGREVADTDAADGTMEMAANVILSLIAQRNHFREQAIIGEYMWTPEELHGFLAEKDGTIAALTAKVALLTEALRPFGKLGGDIPEHFDDAVTVQAGIDYTMDAEEIESLQKLSGGALTSDRATLIVSIDGLTAGDFRRARALSEPDKEGA